MAPHLPRLLLYSPAPPLQTGPSRYFSKFLISCLRHISGRYEPIIVEDFDTTQRTDRFYAGIPVYDYREVLQHPTDTVIYFIANNEYHQYCFYKLSQPKRSKKIISVIHDLQCIMNIYHIASTERFNWDLANLKVFFEPEMGLHFDQLIRYHHLGGMKDLFMFMGLGQTPMVQQSDHVILHSYYARQKLRCEISTRQRLPSLHVAQLPSLDDDDSAMPSVTQTNPLKFVIGIFGWMSPNKRIIPVARAFRRFVDRLSSSEIADIEIRFVGPYTSRHIDFPSVLKTFNIEGLSTVTGFVSHEIFEHHMSECSLAFNLRFPSCGETSGALKTAERFRVPVALTRYAAFREERASFFINPEPEEENSDLLFALHTAYNEWKWKGNTRRLFDAATPAMTKPDLTTILGNIL